jgi:GT2 family glycosyltransferase
MKIFSIIVTYNGMRRNWIQKCLDSLLVSLVKTEIIVIDNASADETVNFIQKNYSQIDLIVANENLGFAKANNIGIKKAYEQGADYVFLLNQDAWVEKNTIEKLTEAFEQLPEAGIVSPVHLNGDKTNLDISFIEYIAHQGNTPDYIPDLYFNRQKAYYKTRMINAAAWLISRKCIESVGGFDTLMFYHYGEDDNYCQRVIYHKFNIYIATTATICHDRIKQQHHSEEHKHRISEVERFLHYADITKDDRVLNTLKYRLSIQYATKKIIKFQFKKLCKERVIDKQLYEKAKQSREQNKKIGLNWL